MCKSKWFKFIVQIWKGYIRLPCTFPNEGAYRGNKHSEQCKMIKILNKTRIVRIVSFQTSLRRSLDPRHYTSRPSFQMSDVESRMSDVGCRMSNLECRMSDLGCRMLDVRSRMSGVGCRICTVPQMIPNRKWSRDHKWSPKWTANDPRPQVIPKVDRKWSRKKNRNDVYSS